MASNRRAALHLLVTLGLLATAGLPAWAADGEAPVASATTVGTTGISETVGNVMQRQAAIDAVGVRVERDMEKEIEQPDRTHLPQNPASPAVSQLPELPPDFKPGAGGNHILSPQTVGTSFTGATLSGVNPTLSFPPDDMGAIGPSQYFVFVNGRLVTFNKTTGVADGVVNADPDVFFSTVINGSSTSDPRIRYDRLSGRWILVIINVSTPNRILIAVSDAASAGTITGSTVFTFFFLNIATTPPAISSTCFADYPTLGVDANALYIGTNNFCGASLSFNSTDGFVVRKTSVLGAGPIVVTVFRGLVASASAVGPFTPQGVDNYDPASNEGFFIGVDNATFGTLYMRRVSNPGGTPTVSSNISITLPATTFPVLVPHLGNTGGNNGRLDALDDRLFAAHIRNGRLWTAHNIGVTNTGSTSGTASRNGSRWYELNVPVGSGTPTIVQSGTVFTASASNTTDQRHYWIPSIMVSGQGHAALGFSTAGTNERANAATVGRLSGDTGGTMQTPVLYTSSSTAYNPPSDHGGGGGRRWGDYSYVSLDPLDDMTMWAVEQFCDATNSYGVRVAKLIAPPPATPNSLPDVTTGQSSVAVTLTGLSVSGSGFYDPGANLSGVPAFSHLGASVTNGGATGTPPSVVSATYVNPTTVNLVLNAASATANIGSEKYTLTVTNPDGQTASAAVVHVVGNAPPVATIAAGPSLAEGNAGPMTFNFTVNLSSAATSPVTINYQTSDGTATVADNDYQAATSSIVIPISGNSGVISANVNGDTKFESNETFAVTLTSATNATLGATVASTGTIQNDDAVPTLSITTAVSGNENNSGTTPFAFSVSLSNASSSPVSATYQATDGTATLADNDYQAASGTVTIPANQTSGSITVNVGGDTQYEANETFDVTLSAPSGGSLGNASSTATIVNDDLLPTVSIDNVALGEGQSGTTTFSFTVSLSQASGLPATVDFSTADSTATLANNDYQSASGTLNFTPGTLSQPVTVLVNGDQTLESDEVFHVDLANPNGAAAGTLHGTGTIQNDDVVPALSIGDVSRSEGNTGTTPFVFTVHLSNPTDQAVTVHYQTADGTALDASDYQAASGDLTIPAKTDSGTVTVLVDGDVCGEPDETFSVTLSAPTGATVGSGTGTGTIQNDDDSAAPSVTVVSPNGGETLDLGTSANIQWSAADDVSVSSLDINLSRDGGATYPEVLASGIANSGSFSWTVTGPVAASAFVQVVAHDGGCNSATDVSDAAFEIADPAVDVAASGQVTEFALGRIHPNPTSGSTEIEFQLPREASVRLSVVDVRGREIAALVNGSRAAGRYRARWTGQTSHGPAASGVYFVRYEAGGKNLHRRLVLTR